MRKENVYKATGVCTLLFSALLTVFRYRGALLRLWQGLVDLATSLWCYLCFVLEPFFDIFGYKPSPQATVTEPPSVDIWTVIPVDVEEFLTKMDMFWQTLFDWQNVQAFVEWIGNKLYDFSYFLLLAGLPLGLIGYLLISRILSKVTKKAGETAPLRAWKKIEKTVLVPLIGFCRSFWAEFRIGKLFKPFCFVWLLNFNIFTVLMEALAFYFYFAVSFDVGNLYIQLYKLLLDAVIMFSGAPLVFWAIVASVLFFKWSKQIGFDRLEHFEAMNCGYINSLPICNVITGLMGLGKTLTSSDMQLSQEKMFRQRALKKLQEYSVLFPDFPFARLEKDIERRMREHIIFSFAACRQYIEDLIWTVRERIRLHPDRNTLYYGYSGRRLMNNGLRILEVEEMMINYAQHYFFYASETTLLVGNYSIRTDARMQGYGNFPVWKNDFFRSDPWEYYFAPQYSHILDMDVLRLAKSVVPDNPLNGSFEFGVVGLTEIGKDRGNAQTNQSLKKNAEEANALNDGFVNTLKMARHPAEVDGVCYFKFFGDEQRAASLNADTRDLCYITGIRARGERRLVLPFFEFYDVAYAAIWGVYKSLFMRFRVNRADDTLTWYFARKIAAFVACFWIRVHNTFDVMDLELEVRRGTIDEIPEKAAYFLSTKKIFADRYATDCYREIFAKKQIPTGVGLADYPTFAGMRASAEEMVSMHQYFTREIFKDFDQ